jgi:glucuronoarabinoxylan endo-1,4-beta-xylanase
MFKKTKKLFFVAFLCTIIAILALNGIAPVNAASATVNLTATKQTIRGFGGMNHTVWISDLTDSQTTTAFGNGAGQLGMSILRIHVDENSSNWSKEFATAKKAISLGAIVMASPWNPPSSMCETVNGKKRLRYDQYGAYTNHLNSFISTMKQNGVDLYAISVQNEPDYANDWTWWTATEMLNYMKANAGSLQTRVIAPESFQYIKSMSDPILNDSTALANLDILGAHLYGTSVSNYPYPLFQQKGQGKELWMTEHYTDSSTDANSWPNALGVAYEIHNSMVEAQFNAYIWWYIRRSYGMIKDDGTVSKRGWCMAQFSKFIRPGYVRVDATKNPQSNVYVSAYKNDQNVVVVVVNRNSSSQSVSLSISGGTVGSLTKYTTSGSKSLSNDGTIIGSNGSFSLSLDAQSVTTFVSGGIATPTPTRPGQTPTPTPTTGPTPTPTPFSGSIAIAAGRTSSLGSFVADQYYSGGSTYSNSNTVDVSQITVDTPPAELFNNERYGAMSYTIPGFTAGNSYTVTLYFAETYLSSSGSRRFNVSINGATVLSNFDIYASAGGQNKAIARSFTATANSSGQIVIQFTSVTENPKINGISIKPGTAQPTPTNTPTPTQGATPTPTPTQGATPTPTQGSGSGAWLESGGKVAIEAERTLENSASAYISARSSHTWSSVAGSSGNALECSPDNGSYWTTTSTLNSNAPEMVLRIKFATAGTYNVWILHKAVDGAEDSIHAGLDDAFKHTKDLTEGSTSFRWEKTGSISSISAGYHDLNLWAREDGLIVDKIYLTTGSDTPSGTGPAESGRE